MFSNILVATDLSEVSEKVVCTIGNLKALGTRKVLLIHCLNIRDVGTLANRIIELSRPSFEKQQKILESQGFETTAKMVLGLPQIEINKIAEENDCSMILVGSHGKTMASEIMLGGVASSVIHSATKPVLIMRLGLRVENGRTVCDDIKCNLLEHILFPTDFSDNAQHAFSYVEKIAECGAKRITLLHVQDKGRIDKHLKDHLEEFNQIDTERLKHLKSDLTKRGALDVRVELPYGSPKKEIIDRSCNGDVSLIVMGSQGRGFFGELFLGSVSHSVVRHSRVPVLLIPAIR